MTVATSFYPFDAGAGSAITEAQWQKMARRWLGTGVFDDYLNELEVTADGSGMTVSVASGGCWIEGFLFESDAAAAQTIAAADATNGRIDYVVVELDRTANTVAFKVVTGTAASSPVAPTLTQTDALWQMPLATVTVDAAVGVIAADKVTDKRIMGGPRTPATMTASAASVTPLVVKGAASQTAPLFEAYDSAGTSLMMIESVGALHVGTAIAGAITAAYPNSTKQLVVRGASNQSHNLSEWQDSAGTVLARVSANGVVNADRGLATTGSSTDAAVAAYSGSAGVVGLFVRGAASQTANLLEVQNSAGTVLAFVGPTGKIEARSGLLVVFPNGTTNTLEVGAADSAGAGFRTVRVPN